MTSILVVEDERLVAKDLQHILTRIGYAVPEIASSGAEALQKAEHSRPDLVLMDIMLKGGVDGIAAATVLNQRLDIPVVYLSAYGDADTVRRACDTQPFGYILKPFTEGDLRSAIEVALHRHGLEARLRERERWLSTTLGSIADGVLTTDPEQRVTYLNHAAEQLTGWGRSDAIGERLSLVFRPLARRASGVGEQALRTTVLIRRNGEQIAVEDSIAPIIDERRHVLGSVLVFRDVVPSERRAGVAAGASSLELIARELSGVCAEVHAVGQSLAGVRGAPGERLGRFEELRPSAARARRA